MTPGRLRLLAGVILVMLWEAASRSGLFYQGVFPSLPTIVAALAGLLGTAGFWFNAATTLYEVVCALLIGGTLGVACGVLVGGGRLLRDAYEPALHYLAPTPKIIFLPILIALCGVGPASKIAMGALSCFFPACTERCLRHGADQSGAPARQP